MKTIVIHWDGGSYTPSGLSLQHYHRLIDGEGKVHKGKFPIEANSKKNAPLKSGTYAAHTLSYNTDSIGVAVLGMGGAVERPFFAGKWPIKEAQLDSMARLVADLCDEYGIAVTRQTVLTHAEVQPTLGVKQKGKWDITWLPGMDKPGDPVAVGDVLRERIRNVRRQTPEAKAPSLIAQIVMALLKLFGRKK